MSPPLVVPGPAPVQPTAAPDPTPPTAPVQPSSPPVVAPLTLPPVPPAVLVLKPSLAVPPPPAISLGSVGPRKSQQVTDAEARLNASIKAVFTAKLGAKDPLQEPFDILKALPFEIPASVQSLGKNPVSGTVVSIGISGKLDALMHPSEVKLTAGGKLPGIGGVGVNRPLDDTVTLPAAAVVLPTEEPPALPTFTKPVPAKEP